MSPYSIRQNCELTIPLYINIPFPEAVLKSGAKRKNLIFNCASLFSTILTQHSDPNTSKNNFHSNSNWKRSLHVITWGLNCLVNAPEAHPYRKKIKTSTGFVLVTRNPINKKKNTTWRTFYEYPVGRIKSYLSCKVRVTNPPPPPPPRLNPRSFSSYLSSKTLI